jgi:hypothetical protein
MNFYAMTAKEKFEFMKDVRTRIQQSTNQSIRRLIKCGTPARPHQVLTTEQLNVAMLTHPGLPPNLEDYELDHIFPITAWRWLDTFICEKLGTQDFLSDNQIELLNSPFNLQWLTKKANAAKGDRYDPIQFACWLSSFPGVFDDFTRKQILALFFC